jgi:hypothetical protein
MSELLTRRRFTVEEYHRMGEAGILTEDNRLELIAGDIVVREPISATMPARWSASPACGRRVSVTGPS